MRAVVLWFALAHNLMRAVARALKRRWRRLATERDPNRANTTPLDRKEE